MQQESSRNPFIIGLSLVFAWMHTMTGQLRDHAGLEWVAAFYACLSLFMVALVLLDKRDAATRSRLSPAGLVGLACLALAPLMLLDLELAVPIPMHPLAVCLMGGYGIAHAYRSWSTPYSEMPPEKACGAVALALVAACGVELVMFLLGDAATCVLAAVVGAAIPVTLHLCYKRLGDQEQAAAGAKGFRDNAKAALPMWRIAVGISVYSFAMGVSWTLLLSNPDYTLALTNIVTVALVVVLVAAFWAGPLKLKGRMTFRGVWRPIVLLMSAAILVAPQVEGLAYELVVSFVRAAQTMMASLWFLVLSDIARRMHVDPSHVVGMGWVFYSLPVAAGVPFGMALVPLDPLHTVLPALTVLALVAIAFLVDDEALPGGRFFAPAFEAGSEEQGGAAVAAGPASAGLGEAPAASGDAGGSEASDGPQTAHKEDDGMGSGRPDRLSVRCVAIARDYGLTNREFDVLVRLAHGRSGAYIAEELTLSENTVKGHTKRLYAKLDVHNRQELINLAEQYEIKPEVKG